MRSTYEGKRVFRKEHSIECALSEEEHLSFIWQKEPLAKWGERNLSLQEDEGFSELCNSTTNISREKRRKAGVGVVSLRGNCSTNRESPLLL